MTPLTIIKKLPKPWTVGGKVATDIELREPTVGDILEAEKEGNPSFNPNAYQVGLACQLLVRAGDYTGPFTRGQFAKMPTASWRVIRDAMTEVETLGEDAQPGQAQPG